MRSGSKLIFEYSIPACSTELCYSAIPISKLQISGCESRELVKHLEHPRIINVLSLFRGIKTHAVRGILLNRQWGHFERKIASETRNYGKNVPNRWKIN